MASDPKCAILDCREEHHVACAVCKQEVCLGGLSEYQRERTLWRSRMDGRPVTHFGCAQTERMVVLDIDSRKLNSHSRTDRGLGY